MKKLLVFGIFCLSFLLVACGGGDNKKNNSEDQADTADTADTTDTDPADTTDPADIADTADTADTTDSTDTDPADTADTDDSGDTADTDPADTADTDPTTDSGYTCGEIYECVIDCASDSACLQECFNQGSASGQTQAIAIIACVNSNCGSTAAVSECAISHCATEIQNCEGISILPPADTNYNSPYGSATINLSIDNIGNSVDGAFNTMGTVEIAFANGTYGNSSMPIVPADANGIVISPMYEENSLVIEQIPLVEDGNTTPLNPSVFLNIKEENIALGELSVYPLQGSQAMLYVADRDLNTGEINCVHAFGEGKINITDVGDVANHLGGITLNGEVMLYSPKNYVGFGDISTLLEGVVACEPVQ